MNDEQKPVGEMDKGKAEGQAQLSAGWSGRKEVYNKQRKQRQNYRGKFCASDSIGKTYIR